VVAPRPHAPPITLPPVGSTRAPAIADPVVTSRN